MEHLEDILREAMIGDPVLHNGQWCVTKDAALAGMTLTREKTVLEAQQKIQTDCPACHGHGHADDSTEDDPRQCQYCGIPMSALNALLLSHSL